jgi:PPP family 3-phenylpropionic acid transporter
LDSARPRFADALALLKDRSILILITASALHWTTLAPYHLFFAVHVEDLGLSPFVAGGGMALGALCETGVMWWFPRHTSGRYTGALVLAFLVTSFRWLLTAYTTDATTLLLIQGLHGFSFGLFYPAALAALGDLVPDRLRATGQGLFISMLGAASFFGDLSSGVIYAHLGGRGLYLAAAGLSLGSALFLQGMTGRRPS